jgi:hypothetical protein
MPIALATRTSRARQVHRPATALALSVATALAVATVTGCSGNSKATPAPTPPPTSTSTPTATTPTATRSGPVPPTPLAYAPEDPGKIGSWVEFTGAVTGTPQQQAALRTWRTYLQVSAEAFNTQGLSISTPESVKPLDAVATGNGKSNVFAVVAARRKAGTFSIGRMIVKDTTTQVRGTTAVISACVDDQSYEVDQTGKTVTPAPGAGAFSSTLTFSAGVWKVTGSRDGGRTCPAAG